MTARSATALILVSAVFAERSTADDGLRPGETLRETDDVFPGSVPETEDGQPETWPVRIVDAWTGRPIPGATVRVPHHNEGGAAPEDIYDLCAGAADRDGWVRLPWKDAKDWSDYIVADAAGYAPNEYCYFESKSCALTPGTDVPIRLLDFTGRPVAGASVALNLGCGHISDQRTTTTDAAGLATLRSILPERVGSCIWLDSPKLTRGTAILSRVWRTGDPPVPIYGAPGVVVAGRVLGQDGKPVKNAVVGAHDRHRPWVRTGEDGRFRLVGVDPWSQVDLYPKYGGDEPMTWFFAPPEGVERTIVLGSPNSGVPLTVKLQAADGELAEGARFVLVRAADGLTATRISDASGAGEFSLPPGRYDVIVEGEASRWGAARATVELKDAEPAPLTLTVPRRPTVRVDASRVQDAKVKLCTARWFRDLDPAEIDGKDVPVPGDERAVFFVWGHEDSELLVNIVETPRAGASSETPVVLDWVPSTRVTARLAGPDGGPVSGSLRVERERGGHRPKRDGAAPADATPTSTTHLTGTVEWTAEPDDPALGSAFGTVRIEKAGAAIDLGEIRLPPSPGRVFTVEIPPDVPTEGVTATLRLARSNYFWTGIIGEDRTLGADLPWIAPGEIVSVSVHANLAPRTFRVAGSPPWVVRWPDTSLVVHVFGADGTEIDGASVLVDDPVATWTTGEDGARLRGIPPGVRELVVAAEGHRAKVLGLVLKEGDPREVIVRLAARK